MSNVNDIFIGSATGNIKGVNLMENSFQNLNPIISTADRSQEIVQLCWTNSNDDADETEFLCALVSRQLKLYDSVSKSYTDLFTVEGGEGKIRGLEIFENKILTCVESGLVKLWSLDGTDQQVDISAGANVYRMRKSVTNPNMIATGGRENPLKVWDLNQPSAAVFVSKNVKNNFLDLRTPIWDTDLRFLSDSNSDLIATCTGHHFIRLFDMRSAGRRPAVQIDYEQDPFTAMSTCRHEKQIVAGTNRGFMGLFDLRSPGKLVHSYKGFAGHISSIEAHPTLPYVASGGLDRFFRLHDLDSKKLLNKVYCKTHLNSILMKKNVSISSRTSAENFNKSKQTDERIKNEICSDDEEIWTEMPEVREVDISTKRKQKTVDVDLEKEIKRKCFKNLKKRKLNEGENEKKTKKKKKTQKIYNSESKKRKNSSDDQQTAECLKSILKSKLKKKVERS